MSPATRITRLARRMLDVLLGVLILFVLGIVVIARVIPAVTGGGTFVVGGGSMEPAIPLGAVVVAIPVATDQLAPGDIVSVRVGEQQALFTHRIVRLVDRADGVWLETKGDANDDPDPSIIPATSVVGRVAVTIPHARIRRPRRGHGPGDPVPPGAGRLPARRRMAARVPRDRSGSGAAAGRPGAHGR